MNKQLNKEEVAGLRKTIHTPFPLINAVISGKQDGKIYLLKESVFIIHKSGFSYLSESGSNVDYNKIADFLCGPELPQYFHIYEVTPLLCEAFIANEHRVNIKIRQRIQLRFPISNQPVHLNKLPEGFHIEPITAENFSSLDVFNLQLDNRFWRSTEDFIQNAAGMAVFTATGEAVSLCYAACIADGLAEIDVATLSAYQQKGLAKKLVGEFINYCIENELTANWDCFEDNVGSLSTANSFGFKQEKMYNFLSIYKVISI